MAVAGAETDPPTPSFAAARDAISRAQSTLEGQDSAAAELNAAAAAEDVAEQVKQIGGGGVMKDSRGGRIGADGVDVCEEEEVMKEPDSARVTRNSPAASHSHLSHLIW